MGAEIANVMVLGAGLCGLTMAWKLQEAGLQTTVIEKQTNVGGLAKTVSWRDFRFDVGPSAFSTQEQPVARNLRALMGRESEIPMRAHRIRFQDRWIKYPLSVQSVWQIPPKTMARALGEYFVLWGRHRKGNAPVTQVKTVNPSPFPQYGDVLDQLIMSNYLQKIRRHPASSLRPSWAALESSSQAPLEALRETLRGLFAVPHTHTTTFHDPAQGFGSIAETLKARIEQLGGRVLTEATLRRISAPDGEVRAVDYHHEDREHTLQTDYVLSTIPVPTLLTLLDPLPEHGLIESSLQLRHHVMTFLCVLLDRPPTDDEDQGLSYFPEPDIPFFRVSYAVPRQALGLRRAQQTCLVIEWMMSPHHPHAQASPEELYKAALPGLQEAGFPTTPVVDLMVHRERQAVPAFTDKAQQTMRQISAYLTSIQRLRSLGQRGTFTPSHLSQTLHDAFRAAHELTHEARRLQQASAQRGEEQTWR